MNYIVYVQINDAGYITAVESSDFLRNVDDWVEMDRGTGDKYHHAQNNYFDHPIITESGVWRYKLVDGKPVECTAEEIAAQEEANKPEASGPTQMDRIEAQALYTAMMTNTLLEEA